MAQIFVSNTLNCIWGLNSFIINYLVYCVHLHIIYVTFPFFIFQKCIKNVLQLRCKPIYLQECCCILATYFSFPCHKYSRYLKVTLLSSHCLHILAATPSYPYHGNFTEPFRVIYLSIQSLTSITTICFQYLWCNYLWMKV